MSEFADAEALVVDLLGRELPGRGQGAPVATKVPNPRPARFVQVMRTGGAARSRVHEEALVTVTGWAASTTEAERLTAACRAVIAAAPRGSGIQLARRSVEAGGMYYDPDPDSRVDRYSFTASITLRAPRS